MSIKYENTKRHLYKIPLFFAISLVLLLSFIPFLVPRGASAATGQITNRSLTIGTAVPSATTSYSFGFTTVTGGFHLDSIKLVACQTAIETYPGGTCTAPTGFSFATGTYSNPGETGFTDTNHFTIDTTGANDCIATSHPEVLCLTRTSTTNDTAGAKTIVINGVTNPDSSYLSAPNYSFYVGISTYSNGTWNTASNGEKDAGTVAAAVVQSLTVNVVVAEVLQFCAGTLASTLDDATTPIGNCTSGSLSGTSVNLGTLDSSVINTSPVSSNGGNNVNGGLIMRTNAVNGSSVSYDAIQDTGSQHLGTLRQLGATCTAGFPLVGDPCIDSSSTQAAFTAGTERFGMTIAGTNCGTASNFYACSYAGGTEHLAPVTGYIGKAGNSYCTICNTSDSGNGYAWQETGAATQIAAATAGNTVADEALVLKFAATPSISTPFGSYQVKVDFIAVPTY